MKITKLELKNFKRFDDLTIDMTGLAEAPKLVLLIGTNGSGKSSVFDAFEILNKISRNEGWDATNHYYRKRQNFNFEINASGNFKDIYGKKQELISSSHSFIKLKNPFYGRSSVRQVPILTRVSLGGTGISFETDSDRPRFFIEKDDRFENDIEKVASSILSDVFKDNTPTEQIKENYIRPINSAFENIFGIDESLRIILLSIKPPLENKTAEIIFKKGSSEIPYNYLSSGEKEIFNILLNLLVRKEYFQDTVYFLDEIDLHLNTFLQKNLLKEITENWIPDNCQLWTASHSLGFIEYANEAEHAAIIDFDNLNFDVPQVIRPSIKNNFDVFEIAVNKEFLAKLFDGKKIFFSENTDTVLYNNLNIDNTLFFNARDKNDVFIKSNNHSPYNGLIDRDYLTDEERAELLKFYSNLYILNYYSVENYLYHPDNLEEYYNDHNQEFNRDEYISSIRVEAKQIRDRILMRLGGARDSYPFHKENTKESHERLKEFRSGDRIAVEFPQMFDSDDFESFYKVFPAKDYGTKIKERQNLSRIDLAKTKWFKSKIEEAIKK